MTDRDEFMKDAKMIYFVGIKGVAMTALAIYCQERGIRVIGSDIEEEFPTDEILKRAGIQVLPSFHPEHIGPNDKPDMVIYTGAHGGRQNPEVIRATSLNIPVLAHGKALGLFMNGYRQLSVAGSHGKTTTSAMIATILSRAQKDPSYAIGCGEIFGLGPAGHFGGGDWFIAEADEYVTEPGYDQTPRFLWQHPDILVITNIDYDHPDAYKTLDDVKNAFIRLRLQQTSSQTVIINADDEASSIMNMRNGSVYRFGCSEKSDYVISHITSNREQTYFTLTKEGMTIGEFCLKVPGKQNVLNATAAALAGRSVGLSWDEIRDGLSSFLGTKRRFEHIATVSGVLFFDDYAHHPKEITATLEAVRLWYPERRIITIFQPHTYSRTQALFSQFGRSFAGSDIVLITDIYASAREHDRGSINSAMLVQEISKHRSTTRYAKDADEVYDYIHTYVTPNDLILFMGAGDIYRWGRQIVKKFKSKK